MSGSGVKHLPIVGIMGSGSESHADKAVPLGRWLANLGVHLLTGGGGGVMAAVSQAFAETRERQGLVIGILPGEDSASGYKAKAGYPNPWVEIPIFTHLPLSGQQGEEPLSRNHINILSSQVIVALPGGAGTASEIHLAQKHHRPLIAFTDQQDDIPNLPTSTPWSDNLDTTKDFTLSHLP